MKINEIFEKIRKPVRCQYCDRMLMMAKLKSGCSIEIVCPKCRTVNLINLYDRVDKNGNRWYNTSEEREKK